MKGTGRREQKWYFLKFFILKKRTLKHFFLFRHQIFFVSSLGRNSIFARFEKNIFFDTTHTK